MIVKLKENFIYILTFVFFCIILSLAPITGDDWGNYTVGAQGLHTVISAAKGMYFSWEGRFISRIFIYIFTYYKFLFVIVTSGLLTLVIYIANKIIGESKNRVIYIVPIISLLLLDTVSISQSFTWIAGSITYFYPSVIVLIYFYYLYHKKEFKFSTVELFILLIFNVITPMFVENIGLAFVFGNIIWIIINRKEKKSELIKFGILTLFSVLSLMIMLMSPGTAIRVTYEPKFYEMSFINRVLYNIPNFISYTFTRNIIVTLLMLSAILYGFKKLGWKNYQLAIFSVIPVIGIIQNCFRLIPIDISFEGYINAWGGLFVSKWYFIFYWILFGLSFFYVIFKMINDVKEKNFLLFLTLLASLATGTMMAAPVWGERVAIFTEIILIIVSLRLLRDCFNPRFNKFLYILLAVIMVYFIVMFSLIFIIQRDRDNYIEKQLSNKEIKEIYVYDEFITYIWTRNPYGDYHAKVFKSYYNIDQKIVVTVVDHKFKKILKNLVGD